MAPFEIDFTGGEERDIRDSRRVARGGYPVLPGREPDPRLISELPSGWCAEYVPLPNEDGWCAGGPREVLDFSASPDGARRLAGIAWERWHELAARLPEAQPWAVYEARRLTAPLEYSLEQMTREYNDQPLVRAFYEFLADLPDRAYSWWLLAFRDPVVEVGQTPREEFAEYRATR